MINKDYANVELKLKRSSTNYKKEEKMIWLHKNKDVLKFKYYLSNVFNPNSNRG